MAKISSKDKKELQGFGKLSFDGDVKKC